MVFPTLKQSWISKLNLTWSWWIGIFYMLNTFNMHSIYIILLKSFFHLCLSTKLALIFLCGHYQVPYLSASQNKTGSLQCLVAIYDIGVTCWKIFNSDSSKFSCASYCNWFINSILCSILNFYSLNSKYKKLLQ